MMDDLETRLRSAYRARAANAPRQLHRDLAAPEARRERHPGRGWRVPVAVVAAVVAIVVGAVVVDRLASEPDESGWTGSGITLNISPPSDEGMDAFIGGVVRIDLNGCVYLGSESSDTRRNIVWPAGYTASREPDGTVTILNENGVVVAATGHHLEAGGGGLPGTDLACRAEGSTGGPLTLTEIAPLNDQSTATAQNHLTRTPHP